MSRLNFHHLHYFWAVAKEGNLTRAAQRLHVSQSVLSTQIKRLEEQLGHALFNRVGRSLQLTEAGRMTLTYAESIFTSGNELLALLRDGALHARQVLAEVDDMALLRLLARDSDAVALLPSVVVRDELTSGQLVEYCVVPDLIESFYAITVKRHFEPPLLSELLRRDEVDVLGISGHA